MEKSIDNKIERSIYEKLIDIAMDLATRNFNIEYRFSNGCLSYYIFYNYDQTDNNIEMLSGHIYENDLSKFYDKIMHDISRLPLNGNQHI